MPKKIRELKGILRKAGFQSRPGKGNHSFWSHVLLKGVSVTLCGNDGDDAKRYLEKKVEKAIRAVGGEQ